MVENGSASAGETVGDGTGDETGAATTTSADATQTGADGATEATGTTDASATDDATAGSESAGTSDGGESTGGTGDPMSDIVTGSNHTCALTADGRVRCWGKGAGGTLGHGNTQSIGDDETPASAGDVDVGGTVVQLATGRTYYGESDHTCALLDTGDVRCWGNGAAGQLGYRFPGNVGDDETPASAGNVDVGGTVVHVVAGGWHTCALLDTGGVRCWGSGAQGQLGYGNTSSVGDDELPSAAGDVDVGGMVEQLAAGGRHTCALVNTGSVRCWGDGAFGQLGYSSIDDIGDDETPALAGDVQVGGTVTQITAGGQHTCALLDTGKVRCWGLNDGGQLGYDNPSLYAVGDDETPAWAGDVNVFPGGSVVQVAGGGTDASTHTCAVLDTGDVRCWGYAAFGQLGYANVEPIGDDEVPASAGNVDVGGAIVRVATGGHHTCALLESDAVRCWGSSEWGQLGYGTTDDIGDDETPASAGDVDVR